MTGTRQRSSAPSRAIKREDDEGDDQPGGDVKQSYRGLSNELIRNIYDQVFAAKPEKKSSTRGLNEILVSKRIYHVARLAWLHSYKISSSACRGDKFVAGLLNDETACAAVHDLDFKVFSDHEHTTAAMLRRLPNLQYLRLSFDAKEQGRSANNPLPYPISFQTDFPVYPLKLRHVKALIQSISPRFSAFLRQTAVEHLILSVEYSQDLALGDLPWASLERLAAHFDKAAGPSFPKKVLDLLESQLRAYPDRLPLNTVIIDLSGKVVDSAAMINSTLSIFAPRGATTFRFYTAGAADLRPMGYFGGAVQDLSITSRVPYNLTADRNFASLVGFIEKMPALHRFAFYGLAVLGSDFDLDLDGVVEGELKVEYPMLFALLLCLTDTSHERSSVPHRRLRFRDLVTCSTSYQYYYARGATVLRRPIKIEDDDGAVNVFDVVASARKAARARKVTNAEKAASVDKVANVEAANVERGANVDKVAEAVAGKPYRGLSDEVFLKIYDQLFAAPHDKKSDVAKPGLNDILLEMNLCRRPLLRDKKVCSAICALEIPVFVNFEETTSAMLGRLPNLQTLKMSFKTESYRGMDSPVRVGSAVLEGLAQIAYLHELDLPNPVFFCTDFPICALRIRHVKAAIQSISSRFSAFLQQSAVERLVISVGDELSGSLGDLPWASLQQLDARFAKVASPSSVKAVIDLLRIQLVYYSGPFPLRKVAIELLGVMHDFTEMVESTLSTFALRGTTAFLFRTAGEVSFGLKTPVAGDVQELEIFSHYPYRLTDGRKFAKLVDFVEEIPTLRSFGLFGISVLNVVQPLKLDGLSEARLMVEYPMLFALLTCLARTSLTTLVLATEAGSGTRYMWKRSSRDEPFQLEERVLSLP
ncbi:hypothetical protein B0A53_02944 [Rhodotorula sp. CCFEE 5036]|nr:hypothetical protein B0A53_02944 [Rhodotorula sp. CCFEE 5036]